MLLVGSLDGMPKKVVSLNPSVNEFLALLGVELAGRDVFSYRPRELMKVPIVGTFTELKEDVVRAISPDLTILYYPVQKHIVDAAARYSKAVVAVPTPVDLDHVASVFRFFARLFNRDEEGDRLVGAYRDLLRGRPLYDEVLAVINLGVYDVACTMSYVADALTKAGFRYMRGLPCVFRHFPEPPAELVRRAKFVIYEARGRRFYENEVEFLGGKEFVATPNDTLAHYGPSLPIDLQVVWDAASRGERWAGPTSSVLRPSIRDSWYKPFH